MRKKVIVLIVLICLICCGLLYVAISNKDNKNPEDKQVINDDVNVIDDVQDEHKQEEINDIEIEDENIIEGFDYNKSDVEPHNFVDSDVDNTKKDNKEPEKEKDNNEDHEDEPEVLSYTYEEFTKLSSDEQYEFYLTFENNQAFLKWYNAGKEEYERNHPIEEISMDGKVE